MSFKCQITNRTSREGQKLNKIVVETRLVEYEHIDRETDEKWFTKGTQIVREVNASDEGLAIWNSWSEEQRQLFVAKLR